ncbi:MAG: DegV family protein [Candidatus Diapherotrites archaeon]|nr:DegV family protein [Candidatus Diapherotrites archaeon]
MVSFSVVTDSVYTLPPELQLRDIPVAEVSIIIEDEAIPSSQIEAIEVIRLLKEGKRVTTSAPSPAEWLRVFKEAEEPVVAITVSSKLSASYNNALIAARMAKKEVYVVDSLSATIGQGLVVYKALLMAEEGVPPQEAVEKLKDIASRTRIYLSVGSMEYLARSGRIPWFVGKIGEFLGVHPILEVSDGVIKKKGVARKNVPEHLASLLEPHEGPVIVGYAEPLPEVDKLEQLLRERADEVYRAYVCPDIAVHVGPGSYGYAFIRAP